MAERVPPSMNNMDVLNDYFLQFGPVTAMQINHNRHEAIITFSRVEHAEEAMRWPVVNDPTIGLRPWRSKAGQRGPHEVPLESLEAPPPPPQSSAPNETSIAISSEAAAPEAVSAPGAAEGASNDGASPHSGAVNASQVKGNKQLETGKLLETRREKSELEDRRRNLLQGLTDQLKKVMAKISNPDTTEKNRDQLQVILATIKDKITALTPKQEQAKPRLRVAPPVADWHAEDEEEQEQLAMPSSKGKGKRAPPRWSSWRPRGPPAWATWQNEWVAPHIAAAEADNATPAEAPGVQVVHAVEQDQDDAEHSCGETEEMDTDIEDEELLSAMTAAAETVAAGGEQANDNPASPADEMPVESRELAVGSSADSAAEAGVGDGQAMADPPVSAEECSSALQADAMAPLAAAATELPG